MDGVADKDFLEFLLERFRIERKRFDRSGVYAYTQRLFEDANRSEYLEALKEYRDEKVPAGLISLFKKEQRFYLEKCRYFM